MNMPTCPSCVYAQGICEKTGVKIRYSTGCTYHKPKRITNADRIRSMTDEEMALYLDNMQGLAYINGFDNEPIRLYPNNYGAWLDWLKQEVNDGKEEKEENQPAK